MFIISINTCRLIFFIFFIHVCILNFTDGTLSSCTGISLTILKILSCVFRIKFLYPLLLCLIILVQVLRIPILNFRIQHPRNSEPLKYPLLRPQKVKNIRISKRQTPPISEQKSFSRWCPLIREPTVFNLYFMTGVFPSVLKTANIIPVFKKDSILDYSNYGPISLLSNIEKNT